MAELLARLKPLSPERVPCFFEDCLKLCFLNDYDITYKHSDTNGGEYMHNEVAGFLITNEFCFLQLRLRGLSKQSEIGLLLNVAHGGGGGIHA